MLVFTVSDRRINEKEISVTGGIWITAGEGSFLNHFGVITKRVETEFPRKKRMDMYLKISIMANLTDSPTIGNAVQFRQLHVVVFCKVEKNLLMKSDYKSHSK
jgi:hypothetical protein